MLGIVGDDVTGSSDIGLLFSKWNYVTKVYSYDGLKNGDRVDCDVAIIDTNSRFDKPEVAYDKVRKATKKLKELGCTQFHNKTCSVFRGNIGAEFDAMQDELGIYFSIVVLGYPDAGRTTVNSIHYVFGTPLSQSVFRNDPIHPMNEDNLVNILQSQTKRKVGAITCDIIDQGADALRNQIEVMKADYNYVVLDVHDNQSLDVIAEAIQDYPIICGSASIGAALPAFWPKKEWIDPLKEISFKDGMGTFIPNGSLMPQMDQQISYIVERGAISLTFNSEHLFTDEGYRQEVERSIKECVELLRQGNNVVLRSPYTPERIKATRDQGMKYMGLDGVQSSERVSEALADITVRVVEQLKLKKLITGGGNTSNAICKRLGIEGFLIVDEIDTGLPSCLSLTENPLLIILKSGSFGKLDFLQRSLDYFASLQNRG